MDNDLFEKGVYHCIICNLALFSSEMKYNSHCGWPAFNNELNEAKINKITDNRHGLPKTELRCSECNSHLGHLFKRNNQDYPGVYLRILYASSMNLTMPGIKITLKELFYDLLKSNEIEGSRILLFRYNLIIF